MKLNLFNQEVLDFNLQEFVPKIEGQFIALNIPSVNVVFIDENEMQKLNKEYRKKDFVTDVLSFNLDSKELLGEIYICPAYVRKTIQKEMLVEEILRLIIHGILHLIGYDHDVELNDQTKEKVEMFVKQEKILQNVIS
jgi:probable rRNA maturation factor